MTKVVQLKCPNCGANIPHGTLKCEYCGASFILSEDNRLLPTKVIVCPECGHELPEGSIVCLQCGKILTKNEKDVKKLRYFQKKIRETQKNLRELISDKVNLENTEYIFCAYSLSKKKYFIVTDKRFISYERGELVEVKYEDIVKIHEPIILPEFGWFNTKELWITNIETFEGKTKFMFKRDMLPDGLFEMGLDPIPKIIGDIYSKATYALELSEKKTKDVNKIFHLLKLKK